MFFGQLVIGPPGSGKTTYCKAMGEFLQGLGRRVAIVNLDPANDQLPYEVKVDVAHLITVENVMEHAKLGPNGGLIYCMEFLERKVDWLLDELKKHNDCYFLFDCPGQVELYAHHDSMQNIMTILQKSGFQLTAVHLVDSHYCGDPAKFMSVLLTSLITMLKMAMPHLNILSKADLIEQHGKLHFNLDFYSEVMDLTQLVDLLSEDPFLGTRYKKLNAGLMDMVQNYSIVSFLVMSITSKNSMLKVLQAADKANGYAFGVNEEDRNIHNLLSCAMSTDFEDGKTAEFREKYISQDTDMDEPRVSQGR